MITRLRLVINTKQIIGEYKMEDTKPLVFTRQIAGAEDLAFGFGSEAQIREGESVTISLINAGNIPYDTTRTVKQVLDEIIAKLPAVTTTV